MGGRRYWSYEIKPGNIVGDAMSRSNPLPTSSKYANIEAASIRCSEYTVCEGHRLRGGPVPSTPDALGALWRKRRLLESQKNEVLGATKQDEKNSNANVNEEGGVVFLILLSGIAPCLGSTAGVRIT